MPNQRSVEPFIHLTPGGELEVQIIVRPEDWDLGRAIRAALMREHLGRYDIILQEHSGRGPGGDRPSPLRLPALRVRYQRRTILRLEWIRDPEDALAAVDDLFEAPPRFDPFAFLEAAPDSIKALMPIKGTQRRAVVAHAIAAEGIESVPPVWLQHELPEHMKAMLGARNPGDRGGEDLPDLEPGEIELARVALETVHCEVFSLRVRRVDGAGWSVRLTQEEDGSGVEDLPLTDSNWVEAPTW